MTPTFTPITWVGPACTTSAVRRTKLSSSIISTAVTQVRTPSEVYGHRGVQTWCSNLDVGDSHWTGTKQPAALLVGHLTTRHRG